MPFPLPMPTGPSMPTGPTIACEICGQVVNTADVRSFSITYMTPGAGYAGYQCPAWQHFCCCHEHAVMAALCCLFQHIEAMPGYEAHGKAYTGKGALNALINSYKVIVGGSGT